MVCVILRGVSLAIALSVTGIIASIAAGRHGPFMVFQRLVPILVVVRCPWFLDQTAVWVSNIKVGSAPLSPCGTRLS